MNQLAAFGVSGSFALWLVADRAVHGRLDEYVVLAALFLLTAGGFLFGRRGRRRDAEEAQAVRHDARTHALGAAISSLIVGALLFAGAFALELFGRGTLRAPTATQLATVTVHLLGATLVTASLATQRVVAAYTRGHDAAPAPEADRAQAS